MLLHQLYKKYFSISEVASTWQYKNDYTQHKPQKWQKFLKDLNSQTARQVYRVNWVVSSAAGAGSAQSVARHPVSVRETGLV